MTKTLPHADGLAGGSNKPVRLSSANYEYLQRRVLDGSGIVVDAGKDYLFEARLMTIARRENLQTLNDLCALMRATNANGLHKEVIEAMTTNETLFFRDVAPFDALRNQIVSELCSRRLSTRRLRLWSAAASSGQEAYSIAMLLCESKLTGWTLEIVGTDIADSILERARRGRYSQLEVNRGLPASCLIKYFNKQGMEWQIKDELRRMVRFEQFDLRCSLRRLGSFDVIFCRNVLIYFDQPTKQQIIGGLEGALNKGGYVCLGSAESMLSMNTALRQRTIGRATYYHNPE
jgi:chemotaxis protein methyltransferase CheR